MANIGIWAQQNLLNWCLKGGGTQGVAGPANIYVGLSLGAPSSISFSEVAAGSGYARSSGQFGSATTVTGGAPFAGTISNSIANTYGPFSSSATIQGLFISDNATLGAGNNLWYGNLATSRIPLANDSLVLGVGALVITLS